MLINIIKNYVFCQLVDKHIQSVLVITVQHIYIENILYVLCSHVYKVQNEFKFSEKSSAQKILSDLLDLFSIWWTWQSPFSIWWTWLSSFSIWWTWLYKEYLSLDIKYWKERIPSKIADISSLFNSGQFDSKACLREYYFSRKCWFGKSMSPYADQKSSVYFGRLYINRL